MQVVADCPASQRNVPEEVSSTATSWSASTRKTDASCIFIFGLNAAQKPSEVEQAEIAKRDEAEMTCFVPFAFVAYAGYSLDTQNSAKMRYSRLHALHSHTPVLAQHAE